MGKAENQGGHELGLSIINGLVGLHHKNSAGRRKGGSRLSPGSWNSIWMKLLHEFPQNGVPSHRIKL
jgi:hypothetical protein